MVPVESLEHCPECDAPLAVSADGWLCPHCELELAAPARVWRSRRSWHHYLVRYGLLGLLAGLAVAIIYRLVQGEVPNAMLPVAVGVFVGVGGLLVDRMLMGRLSGRFVAVTARGMLLGTRGRATLLPWEQVGRLRHPRGRAPRVERLPDGLWLSLEDIFETPAEWEDFRAAVRETQMRRTD